MKTIPGVKIELWFLGGRNIAPRQMEVADDGYVGELGAGAKFTIQSIVQKGAYILGVHTDNAKNIVLKKEASERSLTPLGDVRTYEQKCEIRRSQNGTACTWPNDNHLNLAEAGSDGKVRYWEIALVSRNGNFFLTTQCLYEAQCYHDQNNMVVCPFFQREQFPGEEREWPQMVDMLKAFMTDSGLPSISEYHPTPKPSAKGLKPKTGKVLWWNHMSGTGCVLTRDDEEVKVHWTQVTRKDSRLAYLVPGEVVAYHKLVPANRDGAKKTGFQYEALEVSLVKPAQ